MFAPLATGNWIELAIVAAIMAAASWLGAALPSGESGDWRPKGCSYVLQVVIGATILGCIMFTWKMLRSY